MQTVTVKDPDNRARVFYGWRVVGAAFVLAVYGWGVGFYGPPVFLSVIRDGRGWPLAAISAAVTLHFLTGAIVGGNLPRLHARFGSTLVTKAGAVAMAVGIGGWALAAAPWQLFVATAVSGIGWGTMSAAALNAFIAPWFVRRRPAALAMAYNGGSAGGILFSPLWVAAIAMLGFPAAALAVGVAMVLTIWILSDCIFIRTPESMGLRPDSDGPEASPIPMVASGRASLPGSRLWRDRQFITLAAGMALGLFAQIGLVAHLYSLMTPALGTQNAGLAMGLVTAMAIAGRTVTGWLMPPGADRRIAAAIGYGAQLVGSVVFLLAAGTSVPLLMLGVVLFGIGFGNATSLPPLIAQVEFAKADSLRAVALVVAIAQGAFSFAPAVFGVIRTLVPGGVPGVAPALFAAAAAIQGLAIAAFLAGRGRRRTGSAKC